MLRQVPCDVLNTWNQGISLHLKQPVQRPINLFFFQSKHTNLVDSKQHLEPHQLNTVINNQTITPSSSGSWWSSLP